ncbi:MAG: hypothetical protein RJA81_997 [Planctomycetota bacterium]|jgi:peptidoglycan/LPS O-acetylase OafA/YrhL
MLRGKTLSLLRSTNQNQQGENVPQGLGRSYLPELDSLRFFAFVLVFGFHNGFGDLGGWIRDLCAMTVDLPFLLIQGSGGIGVRLGNFVNHAITANGWIGVNLFFTLSGFIITRLLLEEQQRYGSTKWSAFWMRRILRIWPLYFVIMAIGFLGFPAIPVLQQKAVGISSVHLPWFTVFLGNWSMIHYGPIGSDILSVLWSVCVEEQFYLFIPIVIGLTGKSGRIAFCCAGILMAIWRRWFLASLAVPQYQLTYDSLAQMDSILAGVLLAILVHSDFIRTWLYRKIRAWHVATLLISTLFLISRNHLGHEVFIRRVLDPVVIALISAGWVLAASIAKGPLLRSLSWWPLVYLGKISYGLYLWHEVILTVRGGGFLSFFLVILISIVSYHLFEQPILKWKRRWSRIESRPV